MLGLIVALDLGLKKCGWAVSDSLRTLAIPKGVFRTDLSGPGALSFIKFISNEHIDAVIYGDSHEQGFNMHRTHQVSSLLSLLQAQLTRCRLKSFKGCDERYSTAYSRAFRKPHPSFSIDAASASIILQEFLDRTRIDKQDKAACFI